MCDNEAKWVKDDYGSCYYYYSNGRMATGWQKLDGDWYYFYPEGSMAHGAQVDRNFLGHDGRMVTDEKWVNTKEDNSGTWYYVGSDEKLVRGWNKVGDDFHYFNYPGGSMTYDNTINGFYIDNDGKIAGGTGWLKDEYSGDSYYFSDGGMKTGWIQDSGRWYYLNDDGKMATGWKYVDGDWYYLHSDGTMATGWVDDNTEWYFLYNNGSMAHNKTFDGYHVDKSGKMVTGTGWVYSDGSSYYLKNDGEVETDWFQDKGIWYYLYPEGSMAKGWIQDKGKWYYLKDDGAMEHDTWIDKYYLNDDGEWVTNKDDESGNSQGTSDTDNYSDDEITRGKITDDTNVYTWDDADKYINDYVWLFGTRYNIGNKIYRYDDLSDLPEQIIVKEDGYTKIYNLQVIGTPVPFGTVDYGTNITLDDGRVFSTKKYGYVCTYTDEPEEPKVSEGIVFVAPGEGMFSEAKAAEAARVAEAENIGVSNAFEKEISKMSPNDRVAAVKTKAKEICDEKGFIKDNKLSKINERNVYRDTKTGKLYAVDSQHGRFEMTNAKGKHQGEVNFDFEQTKPADKSGGHDLKIK